MAAADQSFDISDRDLEPHSDDDIDTSFDTSDRDLEPHSDDDIDTSFDTSDRDLESVISITET